MEIEIEIEGILKRIALLEKQNARFKSLLESAMEVTTSKTSFQRDENQFLEETIKLIEDEKQRMQQELNILTESENMSTEVHLKKLESENLELRKKIDVLLNHAQKQTKEIQQLKAEQSEFRFLLTQPNMDTKWLKSILQLDTLTKNTSLPLLQERHKLQRRIITLERRKTELLFAIEDVSRSSLKEQEESKEFIKANLEKCLSRVLDDAAEKRLQELQQKVTELEQQRCKLLNELQLVLDNSRKEIANEYCQLQQKILEIETQRAEIMLKLKSVDSMDNMTSKYGNSSSTKFTASSHQDTAELDNVLNAFTNMSNTLNLNLRSTESRERFLSPSGFPTCILL